MAMLEQWKGFKGKIWQEEINTRDFIQNNYTPYDGDESFLAGPADSTNKLWGKVQQLQKEERAKGGVLDMDTHIVSGITSHEAGYIDPEMKDLEKIVGLQTDKQPELNSMLNSLFFSSQTSRMRSSEETSLSFRNFLL